MTVLKQLPDLSISKVSSTFVGSALAISIIVMENGAVTVGHNYDCSGQKISYYNEKTNVYASFALEPCISFNMVPASSYISCLNGSACSLFKIPPTSDSFSQRITSCPLRAAV